jgi:uncharacterized protein (DUF433 family)
MGTASDQEANLLHRAEDAVIRDPEIMGGELCLRGTRMPVYMVAAARASGQSVADLVQSYPSLTPQLIELATVYAAAHPPPKDVPEPPWRHSRPVDRQSIPKLKGKN